MDKLSSSDKLNIVCMLRLIKTSKHTLTVQMEFGHPHCYILGHGMAQPVMSGISFTIIIQAPFKPAEKERVFYKANLPILRKGRSSRMVVKPQT